MGSDDPLAAGAAPVDPLLAAVRRGESDAVARLYQREHPTVWRLCLGFLADRAEADDVAQDAMLKLLDTLDRYDPTRPFASWRNTVVLNLCRDRLRRVTARAHAESVAAARELPATLPSPVDHAERTELRELVTASLSRLTPREREVFVLHDLEGEPAGDVATALAIAPSTVRVLLMTARRRLRELLAPRLALPAAPRGAAP